ncbi:MAG TPA: terminase family protein, partial [Pirellulaceae bacterium]|nr:terminase family protein [Pirellulaceae bacterium]
DDTDATVEQPSYCPHQPWPKQQQFLDLTCKEAFYGGAAAGGKSEALLMAALQYIHVPGYAALILRKDTQRLRLAGGLIPRSFEWFAQSNARWQGQERRWLFPTSGAAASISFGYLKDHQDKYRYGSSEFQFIAFDELTEFPEEDYLFLFSRLRRRVEIEAPLRMRSASNPGNLGHAWVMRRFLSPEAIQIDTTRPASVYWKDGIAYIPARIVDNPAVNEEEYRDSLSHLPPVARERLMNGDWTIREEGLIRSDWLLRYQMNGEQLELLDSQQRVCAQFRPAHCRRFITVDPAGTSADKARERRGKPPCWTVMQVWDQPLGRYARYLFLRHLVRERVGFDGLCSRLRELNASWQPAQIYIEGEKLGQAAVDVLGSELPLSTISTQGQDKVARSSRLITKLERGEIRLPSEPLPWLAPLEAEWLGWTGLAEEVCDQVDAAAYAAIVSEELLRRTVSIVPMR